MHLPTTPYPRFHLAFPVTDLVAARRFYGGFLGCPEGRSSDDWIDFDFFGHQIVAHKVGAHDMTDATSLVDGQNVPVRHFGVVVDLATWEKLAERFRTGGVKFVIEPYVRAIGFVDNPTRSYSRLHTLTIDATKFAAGVYTYKVRVGNDVVTKKMIVQ